MDLIKEPQERLDHAHDLLNGGAYTEALQIFLSLDQEGYKGMSVHIGWICDNINPREPEKAKEYYERASFENDAFAQHALAGIFYQEKNIHKAIEYYRLAAENGRLECYYPLYKLLKGIEAHADAEQALHAAAKANDPFAVRDISLQQMRGKNGVQHVLGGFVRYIVNVPALIRSAQARHIRK